jgi:Phosphoglucose isomerase N-terminal domain/Bacterial phospho-glucose isomerase C-terminal SIS domain
MLDSFEKYDVDSQNLARALEALPGSYDGATRPLEGPFGVLGFGEGALPAEFAKEMMDAAVMTLSGTQFILAGGFDFGAVDAATLIAEASGTRVFRMGLPRAKRVQVNDDELSLELSDVDEDEADGDYFSVETSSLSAYTYSQALAHLTGNQGLAEGADEALRELRQKCKTDVPTEQNPAKQLAWNLWTRTAILIPVSGFQAQAWAWQVSLSRLGKSLCIPIERNALEIIASGFEARHESGDALVALLLGGQDEALGYVREILESRVDEVITVPAPSGTGYAANLGLWYLSCWVGFYLALLYNQDPKDSAPLERLHGKSV